MTLTNVIPFHKKRNLLLFSNIFVFNCSSFSARSVGPQEVFPSPPQPFTIDVLWAVNEREKQSNKGRALSFFVFIVRSPRVTRRQTLMSSAFKRILVDKAAEFVFFHHSNVFLFNYRGRCVQT